MAMYKGDMDWLTGYAEKQEDGSYKCKFTKKRIGFIRSIIEVILPLDIIAKWWFNRPYCPGCNPERKILKPSIDVKRKEVMLAPRIP